MSPTVNLRELTALTDQTIVKGLENVPGVARIDVNGRVTRQILVQIRPCALNALGIGVDQVIAAIRAANQDLPAGRVSHGSSDAIVRIEGKIKDPAQFGRDHRRPAGRRGRSTCRRSPTSSTARRRRRRSRGSTAGRRSRIDIQKAQDANIVETGKGIDAAVKELQARLPPDVELRSSIRRPTRSRRRVNRVKQTIVEGALLTVLIVFLFLHSWRSTVITGLTLPIAVIATFIALQRVRLHAQLPDADGAVAVHRPADRRRDRGAREHRPPPRDGQGPRDRGARGHRRDRARRDGDHLRHRRGVRADRVHERHHRQVLLPVRPHRRGGGAGVAVRELHARPDALVGLARPAEGALPARAVARPHRWSAIERGVERMHAIYGGAARLGARPPDEGAGARDGRCSSAASRWCR